MFVVLPGNAGQDQLIPAKLREFQEGPVIYKVAVKGSAVNQLIVNTWHVTAASGQQADICLGFQTAVLPAYLACLNDAYTVSEVSATDLTSHAQSILALAGSGADVLTDSLPPQSAGIISWKTGYAGRKYRGRSYIGPMSEGDQVGGTLTAQAQQNLEELADALLNNWPLEFGGALVLYHKGDGTTTNVLTYVARATMYTQRRRTIGVGG